MSDIDRCFNSDYCFMCKSNEEFMKFLVGMFFIGLSVFAIIGNSLVISSFYKIKKLQTTSNYLVVSLAAADLVIGLIVMLIRAAREVFYDGRFFLGFTLCQILAALEMTLINSTVMHLVFMAWDRYDYFHYSKYVEKRSKHRPIKRIIFSWVYGAATAFICFLSLDRKTVLDRLENDGKCYLCYKRACLIFRNVLLFFLPLIFLLVAFVNIALIHRNKKVVREISKKSNGEKSSTSVQESNGPKDVQATGTSFNQSNPETSEVSVISGKEVAFAEDAFEQEEMTTRTFFIMAFFYLLFWSPLNFLTTYYLVSGTDTMRQSIISSVIWIQYLNSVIKPFIYFLFNITMRHAMKDMLHIE